MADNEKEMVEVNAGKMPVDLVEMLDIMRSEDETSRSGMIRKLIRQEWVRRQGPNFLPTLDSGRGKAKKPTSKIVAVTAV